MTLVVGASVAVKWLVDELDHEAAQRLLDTDERLVAPDFLIVEAGNVLWRKVRRGELVAEQAITGVRELPTYFELLGRSAPFVPRAVAIAAQINHPVYDRLYLACAEQFEAPLVTADAQFASIARTSFSGVQVIPLSDLNRPQH
ncbi:MAG: type II toxin-antitoxin system VapC family toxin [Hyphomicrobiales bacterium]|nr:type II toxin-antitoxin system VapC family toxin [Hyphomicrobiales bacterium]